jgi:hypothetical protein
MLTYGELGSIDLTSIADFVGKLTQAGALIPDEGLENFLRDVGNLPPADHESPLSTLIPGLGMPEEMDTETVDTVTTDADDVATMRAKADALGILIRAGMEPETAAKLVGLPGARFTGLQPTTLKAPGSE